MHCALIVFVFLVLILGVLLMHQSINHDATSGGAADTEPTKKPGVLGKIAKGALMGAPLLLFLL